MLPFLLFCCISLVVANPILAPGAIEQRTLDEIYQAALKERGPLRVAWGGDTKISGERITRSFSTHYPGIELELQLDLSKYLDSAIDRSYQKMNGSDNGADVAVLQSLHDFTRWNDERRLLPYKVTQFDDIYPQFVDPDGAYTGLLYMLVLSRPFCIDKNTDVSALLATFGLIIYNPKETDNTTLPTTYPEFLKPEWKDKLILTYPNDDDAILYLFTLITQKYGFDFIQSLAKNQQVRWSRGSATPSLLIGTNDSDNASAVSFASSSAFAPNVAILAPEDTYMAWPQTGAIFATTTVPESAKLFMNFLLTDAWQAPVSGGKFSVRQKYDRAGIFRHKYVEPMGYVKFMADRAEVERWRFQFENIIGPPQGPNPAKVF